MVPRVPIVGTGSGKRHTGTMTTASPPTSIPALVERSGLWPIRVLWFLLPVLVGPGLLDTVDGRSAAVATVVEVLAWGAWFIGLVSVFAPSTVTLTALRMVAPAAAVAPLFGAVTAGEWPNSALVAIGTGLVVTAVALLPSTGDPMINGSAYGAERRMALRPPASVLVGPLYAVWALVFAGTITGPLLLAAGNWWLGLPLLALGALVVFLGSRSFHQLSRRWIVFVPAGFVIHDYWSLAESLLFQRSIKPVLGPVRAGLDRDQPAVDLTAGARGLALAVRLTDPMPTAVRNRRAVESRTATEFWFAPTLPGRVIAEARTRAIRID